jgi:predicted Holliday junction resolvase-like endonuclease
MELIKWLTSEDHNNTPSLVIVIIVVCVVLLESTVLLKMFLPVWFQKKDDSKSYEKKQIVKNSHMVKILTRLDEIDKRFDGIEIRLNKRYEYIREAALQSGIAVVWSSESPFIELVRAALLNIRLGANGNLRNKLLQSIMKEPNGRKIYQSVLSAYINERKERKENIDDHFYKTIEWIEKRIDGGY